MAVLLQPLGEDLSIVHYVVIAIGATITVIFLVVILPRMVIRQLPPATVASVVDPKDQLSLENDRLKLRNEFRTTCVSFVGGLALIAGLLISFQQFQSSQQALANSVETSRTQLEIAQQVARNQQFVDNVENLGDSNVAVRVAAVEILDDIGQRGELERVEVASILVAFVHQRAPWPPPPGDPYPADADVSSMPRLNVRHADVDVAVRRLGQRTLIGLSGINLSHRDLRGADFRGTNYSGRHFIDVHMGGSLLDDVDLTKAVFSDSDLSHSTMTGAKLCGTWLGTADLTGADLRGAIADDATTWPYNFDHEAAGVIEAQRSDCTA